MSTNAIASDPGAQKPRRLTRLITALGVAQIISWGTLFYAIAVLGASMRHDLAISDAWLFGAFTVGLLVSGIASPMAGRLVDRNGGHLVLACGSALGAAALAVLALADGLFLLFLGWALAGLAMSACLYDPAFSTLHQLAGTSYRRAVTALTLFGGFASTVFWPLSQFLLDAIGWRATLWIYALLHVALCLPLHLLFVPRHRPVAAAAATTELLPRPAKVSHRAAYVWLATALSLVAFLSSALAAHLITLLKGMNLTAHEAVLIGSLIGPMQVAGRIAEFVVGARLHPLTVGTLAFATLVLSLALLTQVGGLSAAAFAFAVLYGWSVGILTIVRGTVPAELFGRHGYGALLGALAQPQFFAKAIAPAAFTIALGARSPQPVALYVLAAIAVVALVAYELAVTGRRAA